MNSERQLIKQVYALSKEKSLERVSQILLWEGKYIPEADNLALFEDFSNLFDNSAYLGTLDTPSIGIECSYKIPLNTKQADLYYKNIEDFFNRLKTFTSHKVITTMESEFYIIQDDISNTDALTAIWKEKYESLQNFLSSLKIIAHHSTKSDDLVFISHSEKKDISIVVSTSLKEIPNDLVFNKKYDDFLTDIINEDNNNLKIKAIFRSSLSEFFEKTNQPNKLHYLLDNYKELQDIYQKNYEIFVNGVSLNKIKSELAQEQLKLFEAVNKGMQEVTSRVMLIPGFAFLSMILRSQFNMPINDFWLIGVALLFVSCIVLISIINQQKMLSILDDSASVSIENISKVSFEIQDSLNKIIKDMVGLIQNNKKILEYYFYACWIIPSAFMFLIGGFCIMFVHMFIFFICYKFLYKKLKAH